MMIWLDNWYLKKIDFFTHEENMIYDMKLISYIYNIYKMIVVPQKIVTTITIISVF